jgi:acyl-CoA synthetase (AMP-forming)/AMP-acid ligase II
MSATLVDAIRARGEAGDEVAIWFEGLGVEAQQMTCAELLSRSAAVAARLDIQRGDKVVIVLPTSPEFVLTFCGTLLAGGVNVPLYPPAGSQQLSSFKANLRRVVRLVRPAKLVAIEPLLALFDDDEELRSLTDIVVPSQIVGGEADTLPPPPGPDDLALIQFSSGSTGEPHGVALTHHNIVYNVRAFQRAIEGTPDDVAASWLPMYHDMGLIGTLLGTITIGMPLALFPPLDFLRSPRLWLDVMSRYRVTCGVAPQFAYNLCLRKLGDDELEGLDLSSLRLLLNGAEATDLDACREFERRFSAVGLRRGVITPCYGLAEHALAVSIGRYLEDVPSERLDRASGTVGDHGREIASVGPPVAGSEVEIWDADGNRLGEREIGEITVRSESICQGYVTEGGVELVADEDGWLRTGDLGFLADGHLYIVDRLKDVVVVAGRNVYPHDIERELGQVPFVRVGRVAAFAIRNAEHGTEALVVAAESSAASDEDCVSCVGDIRTRLVEAFGISAYDIVLLPRGRLPLTTSGKVRRHRAKHEYEDGLIDERLYSLRAGAQQEEVAA